MGNRTLEETRDSAGQVAFELSRFMNAINRAESETIGGNQRTTYQYDANGDLIEVTNGLSQGIRYELDGLRRKAAEAGPMNVQASLEYNSLDAITQAKDFKGAGCEGPCHWRGQP